MRRFLLLSATLLLVESAVAVKRVVESLHTVPDGWRKSRDADPAQYIRLRIALEQPHLAKFEQTLYDISTPQHALYGQHLSREALRELMKPRDESTTAVIDWLKSSGISSYDIETAGEWVNFKTTVGKAEHLLDAEFGIYSHIGSQVERLRTLNYSVPENVRSHITMIQPTTVFGMSNPQVRRAFKVEDSPLRLDELEAAAARLNGTGRCATTTTPACLRLLYGIGNHTADPTVDTIFGVSGFLEQYAKFAGLKGFLNIFASHAKNQSFTVSLVNGGLDNQNDTVNDDIEANLDMQYAASLGFNTDIRFYSTGGRGPLVPDADQPNIETGSVEPYLEWVTYLLNLTDDQLPRTLTTSYGDNEQNFPPVYAQKVCTMLGELGARGVSVIFSSGDTGPGSACITNDGKNTTRFTPSFPGSCPYITSVGGTRGIQPEIAVSFSSGGFSDLFPRPSYQDAAVTTYLGTIGETFSGLYNVSGRGYPDVAAMGVGFQVVSDGQLQSVSGTSGAAPTFAAIVSLLNNALVGQGKAPLGFLNPWLYSTAAAGGGFTDITAGGSRGCFGESQYSGLKTPYIPGAGWNATVGWDPVTGLGTPLFKHLLALASGDA